MLFFRTHTFNFSELKVNSQALHSDSHSYVVNDGLKSFKQSS